MAAKQYTTAPRHLLERFSESAWFADWLARFEARLGKGAESYFENLANPSVKALLLAAVHRKLKRPLVVVCPDPSIAIKYEFELNQFLSDGRMDAGLVERYPAEDFSPYDLSTFPVQALKQQYEIVKRLQAAEPFILLISPKNLLLKHLSVNEMDRHALRLTSGQVISPEDVVAQCLALGYLRASMIMDPGEFSSRGDIFDLYPVNGDPVRIEFFGDTIENIRVIDVENQRSVERVKETVAIPRAGIVLSPENREKLPALLEAKLKTQGKKLDALDREGLSLTIENQVQALAQSFLPDGIDYYAPLVHDEFKTVADYLPADALVVLDDWHLLENNIAGLSDRITHQYEESIQKGRLLDLDFQYHLTDKEALTQLRSQAAGRLIIDTLPLQLEGAGGKAEKLDSHLLEVQAADQFKANMEKASERFHDLRRAQYHIFVTTDHPQRVLDLCKEWDVPAQYWTDEGHDTAGITAESRDVVISKIGPHEGFLLPEEKMAHFTDAEMYGRKLKRVMVNKDKVSKREDIDVVNSIHDLRQGDYVVHAKHGIGQFVEVTRISIEGEKREYLSIQYSGADKLHVPVDQLNMLSRYRGAGEKPPKLSKMGGMEWSKVKSKVKKSIEHIAKDLMALYAARAKVTKSPFDADSPWQVEMEEAFPYTETPDQDLRGPDQPRANPHGDSAGSGSRRTGVLRAQPRAKHLRAIRRAAGAGARGAFRRRSRADERARSGKRHARFRGASIRRVDLHHHHRVRSRYSQREHHHHRPGRSLGPGAALPDSRTGWPQQHPGLCLLLL